MKNSNLKAIAPAPVTDKQRQEYQKEIQKIEDKLAHPKNI